MNSPLGGVPGYDGTTWDESRSSAQMHLLTCTRSSSSRQYGKITGKGHLGGGRARGLDGDGLPRLEVGMLPPPVTVVTHQRHFLGPYRRRNGVEHGHA